MGGVVGDNEHGEPLERRGIMRTDSSVIEGSKCIGIRCDICKSSTFEGIGSAPKISRVRRAAKVMGWQRIFLPAKAGARGRVAKDVCPGCAKRRKEETKQ